jgi:geranylgeranyl diphosphate synthase type II
MKAITRIEQSLAMALAAAEDASCPPKLASAVRHAVFPGGARIRPQLCLAVAQACGQDDPALSDAAAVAIELLHCASLYMTICPALTTRPPGVAAPRCTGRLVSPWLCLQVMH